ncbi:ABC transporter ATP-binding protein [Actinoplanes sp. RD1]|uniref:ABC transporter ATP-binding protein n=1 Tax=Actinoplanes sp. RD1 TaxID=3064538 RepID=UPI0027423DB4|nr:ATP-binding cassette domain-containing protein [Actinoplanes sp. RD1]
MGEPVISVAGLSKSFGAARALAGVTLEVPGGTVLGLLGHNGAGKSTLIGILSTLLAPTAGTARVAGHDVVAGAAEVRRRIGLTGQYAAVDDRISGHDNLVLIARLLGFRRRPAAAVADELLATLGLGEAGHRKVRTYSGGMRRRLDLAAGLVGDPEVLFLDEPTTGLDPESRLALWEIVEQRVAGGATVLLTTQYLDEADRLADRLAVLDDGRVVFAGRPDELKARYGRRVAEIATSGPAAARHVLLTLRAAGLPAEPAATRPRTVTVPVADGNDLLRLLRLLDENGCEMTGTTVHDPTLDDVYLAFQRTARPETA